MNIALCTHWLEMGHQEETRKKDVDYLTPSKPMGCINSNDPNTCTADAVGKAILDWWGGPGMAFWDITCRGGVLGPIPPKTSDDAKYCMLAQELWRETAVSMLDGITQTALRCGVDMQNPHAIVEGVSRNNTLNNLRQALAKHLTLQSKLL